MLSQNTRADWRARIRHAGSKSFRSRSSPSLSALAPRLLRLRIRRVQAMLPHPQADARCQLSTTSFRNSRRRSL